MHIKIAGVIAVLVLLGAGVFFFINGSASPQPSADAPAVSQSVQTDAAQQAAATGAASYTLADVAAHNSAASCWSAINGKVYDLTAWINQHPGGPDAILSLCGTDGSAAFNAQHGGQRRPENELTQLYVADLTR